MLVSAFHAAHPDVTMSPFVVARHRRAENPEHVLLLYMFLVETLPSFLLQP